MITFEVYRWLFLRKEQKSFPHWRGTLTSKIAMREIPDPKSTMGEWYNIKSFPVFKKTGKLFPCFFCYIGTFLYYEGNYFPVFEGKSLPVFLLYRNISLLSRKIIPVFLQIYHWMKCMYLRNRIPYGISMSYVHRLI